MRRRDPRVQLIEEQAKQRAEEEAKRRLEAKALQLERRKQQRAQNVQDEAETQRRAEELGRAFLLGDEEEGDDNEEAVDDESDDLYDNSDPNESENEHTAEAGRSKVSSAGSNNKSANPSSKLKMKKKRTGRIGFASARDEEEMDEFLNKKLSEMRMHKSTTGDTNKVTAKGRNIDKGDFKPSGNSDTSHVLVEGGDGNDIGEVNGEEDQDEDADGQSLFSCVLCDKHFKSKPQLLQHFNNRTHKKKELEAKRSESKKQGKPN